MVPLDGLQHVESDASASAGTINDNDELLQALEGYSKGDNSIGQLREAIEKGTSSAISTIRKGAHGAIPKQVSRGIKEAQVSSEDESSWDSCEEPSWQTASNNRKTKRAPRVQKLSADSVIDLHPKKVALRDLSKIDSSGLPDSKPRASTIDPHLMPYDPHMFHHDDVKQCAPADHVRLEVSMLKKRESLRDKERRRSTTPKEDEVGACKQS